MNMHRLLIKTLVGLAITAAGLVILAIWGVNLGEIIYQLLATIGVLVLLIGFVLVVKLDFSEHKKLKDQNYID